MKTIVIASQNPVKIQAALQGFKRMFPGIEFETRQINVASGVRDQPISDLETLQGASNRASGAQKFLPGGDYWVGIEGGVEERSDGLAVFAWIVVCSTDLTGKGRTATFYLPPSVAELIRQGKELGEADDIVFKQSNSKQANGAIGILTGNVVDRTALYEMAVILALVPFKNRELYERD